MSKAIQENNSTSDSSAVISERLANAKKLNYAEMKGNLKENFEKFMKNPSEYGVKDSDLAIEIQEMGGLSKYFMWKQFKAAVKLQIENLSAKESAYAFITDYEQDKDHQLTNVEQLKKMLDNPSKPKYDLEEGMIKYIKSDGFNKEKFIIQVIKLDKDLEPGVSDKDGFGAKLLNFLTGLWIKIAPLINKIIDNLVDFGANILKDVLDKHVPESLQDEVGGLIKGGAKAIKELDDVATTAAEAYKNGEDVSKAATDHLKEIGTELVENTQEVIESGIRDAMESHIGEVISTIADAAFSETKVEALGAEESMV